jgi:hypothetical protein
MRQLRVAPQITSRYGTEANKAAVDLNVYAPNGDSVHKEDAVSETEIAGVADSCCALCCCMLLRWCAASAASFLPSDRSVAAPPLPLHPTSNGAVTAEGGQGPWRACFRVSKGQVRCCAWSIAAHAAVAAAASPPINWGGSARAPCPMARPPVDPCLAGKVMCCAVHPADPPAVGHR